ncbi:hypothetical protein Airi02_069440 [Actinoallomurus iriomotensis]|uniref:Uncharacterized protein n=1 Tax=Actinoallomurus iriomotensis TaxID=478107 RepID=A0A9W6W2J4_9ACTN|nr:hypothetical protein Airi02_069440 [Actinoallomurus iriomotensis]
MFPSSPWSPSVVIMTSGRRTLTLLVGTHVVDDLYQGAVPALLPFLVAERHYG